MKSKVIHHLILFVLLGIFGSCAMPVKQEPTLDRLLSEGVAFADVVSYLENSEIEYSILKRFDNRFNDIPEFSYDKYVVFLTDVDEPGVFPSKVQNYVFFNQEKLVYVQSKEVVSGM